MHSLVLNVGLLLLMNAVQNGYANPCLNCLSQGEELICDDTGEFLECNEELAERYISLFMRVNENLDVESVDKTRFKCFKFNIIGEEEFHLKGCTYESLPICDNMKENMGCTTCRGKDCNSIYRENYYDDDDYGRAVAHVSSSELIATCTIVVGLFRVTRWH